MIYEQPLYRPPSEARSLILQVTVGCSHNACSFCSMYKRKYFRVKTLDEIKKDIAWAKERYGGTKRIFLADGDVLAMETDELLAVLEEVRQAFPDVRRVSAYAGPTNILGKSLEELTAIREAGISLAYFGIESGDSQVLEDVKKGVTPEEMTQAGKKIQQAGIGLSATVIIGLGGRERWREHAEATAEVASAIDPVYLSALTLMVEEGTSLAGKIEAGAFNLLTPGECLAELRLLIERLELTRCTFRSNHASNYFAVGGVLPLEKERMLEDIDRALTDSRLLKGEMFRGL
ncbi:MAG: B12-binding domain-containing radical SAM protein [Clostridiales bacterium]|nr:B12-binding domain-containing radical SAM protein [Clostridiales bacterium]